MSKIIITGASSGIGYHTAKHLINAGHEVINISYDMPVDELDMETFLVDVRYEDQIHEIIDKIAEIDILINCAGINFIDWIEHTNEEAWDMVMDTNAKGIFLMTKACIPSLLANGGTILNIVSNASHMPMTNSIAYNASKGAAHIMTLQMARELGPKDITVFGISPNRVADTQMSQYIDNRVCGLRGWTEEYAREYQLKALPAGEETDPDTLGEFIAFILDTKKRHKYMAGTIIPYGK